MRSLVLFIVISLASNFQGLCQRYIVINPMGDEDHSRTAKLIETGKINHKIIDSIAQSVYWEAEEDREIFRLNGSQYKIFEGLVLTNKFLENKLTLDSGKWIQWGSYRIDVVNKDVKKSFDLSGNKIAGPFFSELIKGLKEKNVDLKLIDFLNSH